MPHLFPKDAFRALGEERTLFLADKLKWRSRRQPGFLRLREALLAIGGLELVAPTGPEPDLRSILAKGRIFDGATAVTRRGRPSNCHANVARLFQKRPTKVQIVIGYALSDDGLWRQHTWGLDADRVLETTVPNLAYFGVVLTATKAARFVAANAPSS